MCGRPTGALRVDRRYLSPTVKFFKAELKSRLPQFKPVQSSWMHLLVKSSGSVAFSEVLSSRSAIFVVLEPGEGSRAEFFLMLGWSIDGVPAGSDWSRDFIVAVREDPWPRERLKGALLNFEELEGRSAIGAVVISSPRDELATRSFNRLTKAEQRVRAREIALLEEQLSKFEIEDAVRAAVLDVFARVEPLVQKLRSRVERVQEAT